MGGLRQEGGVQHHLTALLLENLRYDTVRCRLCQVHAVEAHAPFESGWQALVERDHLRGRVELAQAFRQTAADKAR